MSTDDDILLVKVIGVYPHEDSAFVLLTADESDEYSDKILPIYIDLSQAHSIHLAFTGEIFPRPLTHDLMVTVIEDMGGEVDKVVVDQLDDRTFYARLYIEISYNDTKDEKSFDARPSDCIALALKAKAPIFVSKTIMDEVGVSKEDLEFSD